MHPAAIDAVQRVKDGKAGEFHSLEPWWIGYAQRGRNRVAKTSLMRAGFEAWYPAMKIIRHPALSSLPSKTRHRLRLRVIEIERPALGSYLFLRRLFGTQDISRLYELNGVGGVCRIGNILATVSDHVIESLRLREARGQFDLHQTTSKFPLHSAKLQTLIDSTVHHAIHRLVGQTLDATGQTVVFVEAMGRVLRVVQDMS